MSFYLNPSFLEEFSTVEKAENYEYFSDISSCVYFWYFPINFKHEAPSLEEMLKDFKQKQCQLFSEVHTIEILDSRQKYLGKISGVDMGNFPAFELAGSNDQVFKNLSQLFLALSLHNKPIYIGKSTRLESTISKRIKEHLSGHTDFSKRLDEILKNNNSELSLGDMIIRVIDIESVRKKYFNESIGPEKDFAHFVEKILINLYKPKFNIVQ